MKNEYGMSPVITAAERTKEFVVEMFCEREKLLTKDEVNLKILSIIDATDSKRSPRKKQLENDFQKITHKISSFSVYFNPM